MCHLITLNPGAPSEVTAPADAIQVPNLWYIAQALIDGEFTTRNKEVQAQAGADVLEAWHLAHALARYIREEAAKMPYGPPLSVCHSCLLWDTHEGLGGDGDIGSAYILATPDNCQSQQHPVEV